MKKIGNFEILGRMAAEVKPPLVVSETAVRQLRPLLEELIRLRSASTSAIEALEDLLEAIPKQTNNADWWPDELTHAVRKARKAVDEAYGGSK